MKVARHSSVAASRSYHRLDEHSEINRIKALGLMPQEKKEDKSDTVNKMDYEYDADSNSSSKPCTLSGLKRKREEEVQVSMTQDGISELKGKILDLQNTMEEGRKVKRKIFSVLRFRFLVLASGFSALSALYSRFSVLGSWFWV